MPKKIDYVIIAPNEPEDSGPLEKQDEEAAGRGPRPRFGAGARPGPGGRPAPGRPAGGAARPTGGYRGPAGRGNGSFGRGGGGRGNNGARGGGAGVRGGRGFGGSGLGRIGTLERPTPKVELPPYMTVKELAEEMSVNPTEIIREMMKHNVLPPSTSRSITIRRLSFPFGLATE